MGQPTGTAAGPFPQLTALRQPTLVCAAFNATRLGPFPYIEFQFGFEDDADVRF
jgi:hypothetical protein